MNNTMTDQMDHTEKPMCSAKIDQMRNRPIKPISVHATGRHFGALCVGALIYLALTVTALGITSPGSRIAIAAAFASGVAVYAGGRIYQRSRGVDTSLAYRYVPPE